MSEDRKRAKSRVTERPKASSGANRGVARGLWPQIAELRASGKSATDIAAVIARSPSCVARTLKEPAVIADIERIQRDRRGALDQEIRAAASMAWGVLVELAGDETQGGSVRRAAACDILDRAGITAKTAIELSGPNGGPVAVTVAPVDLLAMTPDQLRALAGATLIQPDDGEGEE